MGIASREGSGGSREPGGGRACKPAQCGAIFAHGKAKAEDVDGAVVQTVCSEFATGALAPAEPGSTALIIADADLGHWFFSEGIASLGRCTITVRNPRDVIARLQDESLAIGVVLAPTHDPQFRVLEFFEFMRDAFPLVRRIAYAKPASERADALGADLLDVVLTYPTPLRELAEALQPASEAAPRA